MHPVDAAFVTACVKQKLDFFPRLQDVVQGAIKPSQSPSPSLLLPFPFTLDQPTD